MANKVGRRWTHSTLLGINALLFGVVMVIIPYQVTFLFDVILLCYPMSFPQFTISGISELIQVLCMILKMNISATFVVAYIQVQEYYIYYC